MDPIKVDFSNKGGAAAKQEIVIPPERAVLKLVISLLLTLVGGAIFYYFYLPPLNPKAYEFYAFVGGVVALFIAMLAITSRAFAKPEYLPYVKRRSIIPLILIGVIVIVMAIGFLTSTVFFRARSYSKIITPDTGAFAADIHEQEDFGAIPKLDEDAASNLANRALGELANLKQSDSESERNFVSQFTVYPEYTQINYKGNPVRVASLKYANVIKWLYNKDEGLPGYIVINMANESTHFVSMIEDGESIKYSMADHFGRHVKRVLRFEYPTYMFAVPTFEIDDAGHPYWICARLDKTIGIFGGRDVSGVVFVDAVTGECRYYDIGYITGEGEKEFQWVDRIYDSDLLVEQYDYFGRYSGGFWNSILGQEGVIKTTEGYNYLALNDDVYLYTGVTSVTSDESITGFVMINQRTKDTKYYRVTGAKEQTAKETAQGLVLDYGFTSTFPLLLNIGGEPTYFMSLKDDSNVVQRYAMINVSQYNKIKAVGSTLEECRKAYMTSLISNGIKVDPNQGAVDEDGKNEESATVTGAITDIRSAVIEGETCYFIKLDGNNYYTISASEQQEVVLLNVGDTVTVTYSKGGGSILDATSVAATATDAK